mmetsp:Transcript_8182/g.23125  ORF Transcript_8182/g.23125 Transcript_8182/m.23125 type:complete len:205 (-) Transcript_8182:36-650(-)
MMLKRLTNTDIQRSTLQCSITQHSSFNNANSSALSWSSVTSGMQWPSSLMCTAICCAYGTSALYGVYTVAESDFFSSVTITVHVTGRRSARQWPPRRRQAISSNVTAWKAAAGGSRRTRHRFHMNFTPAARGASASRAAPGGREPRREKALRSLSARSSTSSSDRPASHKAACSSSLVWGPSTAFGVSARMAACIKHIQHWTAA